MPDPISNQNSNPSVDSTNSYLLKKRDELTVTFEMLDEIAGEFKYEYPQATTLVDTIRNKLANELYTSIESSKIDFPKWLEDARTTFKTQLTRFDFESRIYEKNRREQPSTLDDLIHRITHPFRSDPEAALPKFEKRLKEKNLSEDFNSIVNNAK